MIYTQVRGNLGSLNVIGLTGNWVVGWVVGLKGDYLIFTLDMVNLGVLYKKVFGWVEGWLGG